ncbi:tetratricopeptide repeat-containing sensor histidine kinase [Sphingobacterium bovistauri]|uniref:Histidine kinase domain-containing protein n=1 Tax=Sphingobacterium bovistauri TaxID=2781959 RepID=A0ABS7Z417_9SPHI|nr:ATP-binding protein [Sphingobacterium bovistauri]MCA5004928.1 hypothetical protein [Sphingobacterium bovistauri]
MKFKKTILGTFLIFVFSFICYSNPISKDLVNFNDSILLVIKNEKDYSKTRIYVTDLLNKNYTTNKPYVIKYIEKNILNNPIHMVDTVFYANTMNTYAICFLETDVDKCIRIAKSAIEYIGDNDEPEAIEKVILLSSNLANAYASLGHHNTSLKAYVDIHPLILKTKNKQVIRHHNFRLGGIYYQFNNLDKALNHLYKGIFVESDFNWHPNFAGVSETIIASLYLKKNEIDSISKYVNLADRIKRKEIHQLYEARIKSLKALTEGYSRNYVKAFQLVQESANIALSVKDSSELMMSQYIKGRIYELQKNYAPAITIFRDVLDRYKSYDNENFRSYILLNLINAYKLSNQPQKVFETYDELLNFYNEEKAKNQQLYTEELSYNMNYNEKVAEIEKLKISNDRAEITRDRNRIFIIGLAVLIALLLFVLILVIKAQKKNKILASQEYALLEAKLEEEKNNRVIDEMKLLKEIEDRERNRIATDLHDSVGGFLSSIKIALYNYQESINLKSDDKIHIDRVLEYIDETKQELNRIVYNLTPLIVEKFGLLEAIKQYCKKIQTDNFKIDLQLISVPTNIIIEDEITLYRIIQEVLHNIVKHANARRALVQIQTDHEKGMVYISMEDDGEGMHVAEAKNKGGLGLRSLYSRAQSLNGTIKIESEKNNGTSIYITCFPRHSKM